MYQDYIEKVNEILAEDYGIGVGTLAYKNTNKETIILSLIMLDLIEELKKSRLANESVESDININVEEIKPKGRKGSKV